MTATTTTPKNTTSIISNSDGDAVSLPPRKRSYSELKIAGPPLSGQGHGNSDSNATAAATVAASSSAVKEVEADADQPLPLAPSRTALLIVDVQPEYWSDCPAVRKDFPHFPRQLEKLIQNAREQNTHQIIWVRADYSFEKSPWLQQFSRLHKGRIPPVVKPSSKWESFATPLAHEVVLTKSSWSSTSNTDLLEMLRTRGIENVMVAGLITSVCVQHSAFGVFEAGFRTLLVEDACADRGLERHQAALALYGGYMYELCNVESIRRDLLAKHNTIGMEKILPEVTSDKSSCFENISKRRRVTMDNLVAAETAAANSQSDLVSSSETSSDDLLIGDGDSESEDAPLQF